MNAVPEGAADRATAAYTWAEGLIALASRLIDEGVEVDLAPIRPAIRHLCEEVRAMPKADAEAWLPRLVGLQHALAALVQRLAKRENACCHPEA